MHCRTPAHILDKISFMLLLLGIIRRFGLPMQSENNHEEADKRLIHFLTFCVNTRKCVDFCFWHWYRPSSPITMSKYLLRRESKCWRYRRSTCFPRWWTCALPLSFHSLTGCGTVGKLNVSKESWTKVDLNVQNNQDLIIAFRNFQENVGDETVDQLAKFICWGYMKRNKFPYLDNLRDTRVHIYKQLKADCEKIPRTKGAFLKHVLRAFHQLRQWMHINAE